jgi:hypothetical protein
VPNAVPAAPPSSGADPFDFISARFDPATPGAKSYKAGAFLDLDPYGLNFDAIDTNSKDKKV